MDYERKYKEALERARKIENGEPLDVPDGTHIPVAIFPELKENNADRTRKGIIKSIMDLNTDWLELHGVKKEDAIAWLEKQEEPSIKWNKNTEENKPSVNHSILMETTHGIAEGEWKGECWYQYRWATCVKDSDVLSWMELSDLDKQGEQKPQGKSSIKEERVDVAKGADNQFLKLITGG